MLKTSLISGVAVAALFALGNVATAQTQRGETGSGASSSPPAQSQRQSPPASPAEGEAPGLRDRTDAPAGSPGSERAQQRTGTDDQKSTTQTQQRGGDAAKPGETGAGEPARGQTTGQVPQVQLSTQQRTELRQQFQSANIRTVSRDRINVSIVVGAVLPATVEFVPIPASILTIVPQFRGHEVVRVGSQIIIVEPGTRRIVYIIEA